MKKLIGFLILLSGLIIIPIQALAADYSIEKMEINAFLQENGDVYVTEKQTYEFKGKFNGITRTLIPKKNTSIIKVEATENGTPLDVDQEDNLYKIYRGGKDETVTIELTYTIKNAVKAYSDVAEFYWPFFDSGNESAYKKLNVFVHPPSQTDDVIAFGYEAAEDTATTNHGGIVHFDMGKVESKTKGDIRVAYDVTLFPSIAVTKDKPMRADILAAKEELKKKQETFEANKNKISVIAPFIVAILTIYLIGLLIYAWRKKQSTMSEVDRLFPLPYFVPETDMSLPATIFHTNHGIMQPSSLTAALLDLIRKKYVKQLDEDTFTVIHRETDYVHERLLIDWLFDKIGHDGIFKLTDLKTYTKKESNQTSYQTDFTAWQNAVNEEVKQHELKEKNVKMRWIIAITGILVIPLIILFGIYELLGTMFFSIILSISLITFGMLYQPRTLKGAKIERDWTEFRNKYVDMTETDWTELVDDEQKRAFIYGIGINDKHIATKNKTMLEHVPNLKQTELSPLLFLLIATNANTHFNQANKVSAASTSSSGTPGAGTGVGGGGGGSGAF